MGGEEKAMDQPTLTPSEAALVRDLLKLWDASYNHPHPHGCECGLCQSVEAAGNHEAATFDSLAAKVGGGE